MAYKKLNFAVCALALFCAISAGGCATPPKKIKISVGIMRTSSAEESALFEECKHGFEKAYPQYEIISSPYVYSEDTVMAKYASGQLPTVFEADASLALTALDNGYIRDVSDDLKRTGWYEKSDEYFLSEISDGEKVCGVPAEQYSAGMVLNLKILHEAGVIKKDGDGYVLYENGVPAYPDTFEKIEQACGKISAFYGGNAAGLFLSTGSEGSGRIFADIVYNFGSGDLEKIDADGNYGVSFTGEEFGNAMRWVKNTSQLKFVDTSARYGVDDWAEKMSEGKTCFAFCLSNTLTANLSAYPALCDDIAFVPMPTAYGVKSRSVWGGTVFAVSGLASAEQTEGVFEFLRYMGYGPDTDEQSFSYFERRVSDLHRKSVPVIPQIQVWNDDDYKKAAEAVYAKYPNANYGYYKAYLEGFNSIKKSGEPFERTNLHLAICGLFEKMLFEATTSNIVTLLEDGEKDFNAKYFKARK